jgi:hypothetical protein
MAHENYTFHTAKMGNLNGLNAKGLAGANVRPVFIHLEKRRKTALHPLSADFPTIPCPSVKPRIWKARAFANRTAWCLGRLFRESRIIERGS